MIIFTFSQHRNICSAFFFYETTILHFYLQLFVLSSQRTSLHFLIIFDSAYSATFFREKIHCFAQSYRSGRRSKVNFLCGIVIFKQLSILSFSFFYRFPIWDRIEESPTSWPNISFFWFLFNFVSLLEKRKYEWYRIGFCLSLLCFLN